MLEDSTRTSTSWGWVMGASILATQIRVISQQHMLSILLVLLGAAPHFVFRPPQTIISSHRRTVGFGSLPTPHLSPHLFISTPEHNSGLIKTKSGDNVMASVSAKRRLMKFRQCLLRLICLGADFRRPRVRPSQGLTTHQSLLTRRVTMLGNLNRNLE